MTTDNDHPGKGRNKDNGNGPGNPEFTPTSCPVVLNDGVKVFDASMNLLLQDDSSLIFDVGAVQAGSVVTDATDEEDFSNDALINDICADGDCNGIPVTECTDGLCDGVVHDGTCNLPL